MKACKEIQSLLLRSTAICIVAGGAAFAAPATAQSNVADSQEAAKADASPNDGVILVTARRREEQLGTIPESISVLGSEVIEQQGIDSLQDVSVMLPNVGFKQDLSATSSFISVRGIAQSRNTDPAVAIVVDGVQTSNASQIRQQLFDVQQIEVLKGPQGALYGRNAIAGAINVVTRAPTNDFEAVVTGAFGNAGRAEIAGGFSGPIIEDELFFRVSGSLLDDDGTIVNTSLNRTVDFRTNKTGRVRLRWEPSPTTIVDLKYNHDNYKGGAYYYVVTRAFGDPFPVNDPSSNSNDFSGSPQSVPIAVNYSTIDDASANVEFALGNLTVNSVTAWSHTRERYGLVGEGVGGQGPGDLDFGPAAGIGNSQSYDIESLSQELRLSSDSSGPFEWMVGAYGILVDRADTLPVFVDNDADGDLADEAPFFPRGTERNINAFAFFGSANYELAPGLDFSFALRYDKESRDQTDLDNVALGTRKESFDLWQPKASLSYLTDGGTLFYGTISRGFRSGGFNSPRSLFPTVYESEKLWSYEAGLKGKTLDNLLQFSLAAFYQDIENRQDFVFDVRDAAQIVFTVPKSSSWGLEAEFNLKPVSGLSLSLNGGLMDSKIKEFANGPLFPEPFLNESVEGNNLPGFSHWSVAASMDYNFDLGGEWSSDVYLGYTIRGKNFWDIRNTDREKNVDLLNANVAINRDDWSVIFWGENILNEKYWSNWFNQQTTALPDIGNPAQERRYGVRFRAKF